MHSSYILSSVVILLVIGTVSSEIRFVVNLFALDLLFKFFYYIEAVLILQLVVVTIKGLLCVLAFSLGHHNFSDQ